MDSNEAPDDYYHFRESEFDAEDNKEKYGVYLVEQHQVNSVDPYVARNQKKPRNTQEYTETIPQHSRPRKPIVQDIYTEDHYCIARSSGNWTSDVGVQDVDGDTMKTTEKNGICSFRKIMISIIVILLLLIISGLSGFVLYHYLNEKGENDHIKKIDNLLYKCDIRKIHKINVARCILLLLGTITNQSTSSHVPIATLNPDNIVVPKTKDPVKTLVATTSVNGIKIIYVCLDLSRIC